MLLELLLLTVVGLLFLFKWTSKTAGLPPGTFGWPIVGNFPPRNKHISEHFSELRDKYGKIFTTKWGSQVVVVISDQALLKKAYNHPDLLGRPDFHSLHILNHHDQQTGVLACDGHVWQENRRFMMRRLKDLGMGKSNLADSIHHETEMLVHYFETQNLSEPVGMDWGINVSVLNVIWLMLAGKRYEADDPMIRKLTAMFDEDTKILQGPMLLLDVIPWLIPLLPNFIYNRVLRVAQFEESRLFFRTIALKIIEDHHESLDADNPRDIIDYYLIEMENQKENAETTFRSDYTDLLTLTSDMFIAGSETTSNTLRWIILYMAKHPEIQQKLHEVLDREVPPSRLPSLQDRPRLAYVDAMILEVMRISSLVPNGFMHSATADVNFEGYTIPKGAILWGTLELFHRDPSIWEKPDQLYPEHFLDDEQKLNSKREAFMPFGVGRRQCLGESMARMELFLFTAALLQRFSFTPPSGQQLDMSVDTNMYILNTPRPFNIMITKRITS